MKVTQRSFFPISALFRAPMAWMLLGALFLPLSPGICRGEASPLTPVLQAREEGNYYRTAELLEGMASRKNLSQSALYYNLGASREALGKSGEALLWYLRSARLNPRNSLLRQGIQRTLPERNELPLPWRMAFWNRFMGFPLAAWLGLGSWGIFWVFLGLGRAWHGRRGSTFRTWARIFLLPALVLGGMALWNLGLDTLVPLGVVTEKECVLRSGYSSNAAPLYSLPEGSVLRILKNEDNFFLVQTPAGNRGWIPRKALSAVKKAELF